MVCTEDVVVSDVAKDTSIAHVTASKAIFENIYTFGETLGQGEFGVVRLATHRETGDKVAVKTVSKPNFVEDEIRLQQKINHKNVVKIIDVIEEESCVHIVMEHMEKGSLFDTLVKGEKLTESEARQRFLQVVDAVETCHASRIAHRDLKAQNILLDEHGNAKLADFGLAAEMVPGKMLTGSCGSPYYAAPELWDEGIQYQGPEIDIWSCGVVLYALLTNTLAFDARTLPALVEKIKGASYSKPTARSEDANDLLGKMLTVDPACRISMTEIREHKWLVCA